MTNTTAEVSLMDRLFGVGPGAERSSASRAVLLSVLTGILFAIAGGQVIVGLLSGAPLNPAFVGGVVLAAICFGVNRAGQAFVAAQLLAAGLLVIALYSVTRAAVPGVLELVLLVLPTLISGLLLRSGWTASAALVTLLGLLAIGLGGRMDDVLLALTLVSGLNAMLAVSSYLRERYHDDLEVRATALQAYSSSLESEVDLRTRNMLATAEIGRAISGLRSLDSLLKQVLDQIVENFKYYHAQVYLVDSTAGSLRLAYSTGTVGQALMERNERVALNSPHLAAHAVESGQPLLLDDVLTSPLYTPIDLLPHTRSQMILPLRSGEQIIGLLDIHSINPRAFEQADLPIFQTLADQLSVAIENVRLFDRAQKDLANIEQLNRQLSGEAWARYLSGRGGALGYRGDRGEVRPITAVEALGEGAEPDDDNPDKLSLPLRVRGETIGKLDLTPRREGTNLDPETRAMLEAVAERISLALDSTRLGQQSQRQAAQELILSQLSASLQASTDLSSILSTAVEQSSKALGTPRGFIHLSSFLDESLVEELRQGANGSQEDA